MSNKSIELVTYEVEIEFYESFVGANPYSSTLLNDYIEALTSGESNPIKRALKEQGLATKKDIQAFIKKATNTHYHEGERFYFKPYMVRAMLGAAAIDLGLYGASTGRLNKLITRGLSMPSRIYIEGELKLEERAIQPIRNGRRQGTIAVAETFKPGAKSSFTIAVVNDREVTEDRLRMLLQYGGHNLGLGAWRPLDCGRFNLVTFQEGQRTKLGDVRAVLQDEGEDDEVTEAALA